MRIAHDLRVDATLKTQEGRDCYWEGLAWECRTFAFCDLLKDSLRLPGDVIECGVYRGGTFMRLARTIHEHAPEKRLVGCDSFQGFPEQKVSRVDLGRFQLLSRLRKKFRAASDVPRRLERLCALYEVKALIVPGFFDDTLGMFAHSTFCFVHLDCDLYHSYDVCLRALYPRLTPGGVIVFDDYGGEKWPGADLAVHEFCEREGLSVRSRNGATEHSDAPRRPVHYVVKPERAS